MMILDLLHQLEGFVSLDRQIYGNPVRRWLIALAVLAAVALTLRLLKGILVRRASRLAERYQSDSVRNVADLLRATRFWFLLVVSVYGASLVLVLPERTLALVRTITQVVLLLQGALWGTTLLTFAVSRYVRRQTDIDAAAATTIAALTFLAKVALWSVVVLMVLANLGVDVTALVAGLGVGGIAVALAAQNILGDLFASMTIVLDKPFVLGDFISVGTEMGSVEHIGLKNTRLRSLSGEQLVLPNSDLLQSRIRNFKRMQQRRVVFTLGVTYQTPHRAVVAIPGMIRQAIEAHEQTRFDRAHFKQYGDSALLFEVVYFVLSPDFNLYMDIQQAVNLKILERFEQEGIEFAYPTQTVYLQPASGGNVPSADRSSR